MAKKAAVKKDTGPGHFTVMVGKVPVDIHVPRFVREHSHEILRPRTRSLARRINQVVEDSMDLCPAECIDLSQYKGLLGAPRYGARQEEEP